MICRNSYTRNMDSLARTAAGPSAQLLFPSPVGSPDPCVWDGSAFHVDGRQLSVLSYRVDASGWTDELTAFHEEIAGDNHYIDIASRRRALAALAPHIRPGSVIADIGCSSGAMLRSLRQRFPQATLIGTDYIAGPLQHLASSLPGVPFLQFDLVKCPLFSSSLDAVVLLNVLEHIDDDSAALAQVFRIVRPGGVVAIEVPAGPNLFDVYDRQLMHFRRYTLSDLCAKIRQAGFEILERSYLGAFLYLPFRMVKKRNQKYLSEPDDVQRQIVARNIKRAQSSPVLNAIMRLEEWLRPRISYPAGIRCTVTCRKPAI